MNFSYSFDLIQDLEDEQAFDYEGYDPEEFSKTLKEIEPDEDVLEKDLHVVSYLSVVRGNKPQKAVEKMSERGKKEVNRVIKKYKIRSTVPKSKTDVTVARMVSTVPHLVAGLMKDSKSARVVGEMPEERIKPLCTPSGASLIPKDKKYDSLYEKWLSWAYTFNNVIHSGKEKEKVKFFGDIIRANSYIPDEERERHLRSLNVI